MILFKSLFKITGWNSRQYNTLQDQANNSFVLILKHEGEGKETRAEITFFT